MGSPGMSGSGMGSEMGPGGPGMGPNMGGPGRLLHAVHYIYQAFF